MAAPTEEEMLQWDNAVAEAKETKERMTRATMPELRAKKPSRTKTLMGVAVSANPPPMVPAHSYPMTQRAGSIPPPRMTMSREPGAGRYQVVMPMTERPKNRKP